MLFTTSPFIELYQIVLRIVDHGLDLIIFIIFPCADLD